MTAPDGRPLALFDNVMPATPSGRIELASDALAERWGEAARLPAYRPRGGKFPLVADLAVLGQPHFVDLAGPRRRSRAMPRRS